ncbi:hypothetical protein [Neopusillimonas aromaticivorans]|uniref:hypothetical protein n=1 Tax=Neopusillimonas aromaticivorans TaxID=2979868 RepID=UPI003314AEAE
MLRLRRPERSRHAALGPVDANGRRARSDTGQLAHTQSARDRCQPRRCTGRCIRFWSSTSLPALPAHPKS